ncbi:MAG: leucine-rich repeat domain-containing protein [Lachnospiraceae bacterium]|nr:leucine-rich repeat domain-containing protein [Lachnospiraceae bacterium]
MNKVNGVLTCPMCGYNESFHSSSYTTSDSGAITKNTNASTSTNISTNTSENSRSNYQTPGTTSGSPYGQSNNAGSQQSNVRPYQQYLNQPQTNNSSSGQSFAEITAQRRAVYGDEKRKTNNGALVICIALLVVFAGIFIPVIIRFFAPEKNSASSSYGGNSGNRATGSYSDSLYDNYDTSKNSEPAITVPETPFFSQAVCLIFNKEIDEISAEDTAQVISLHVYEINYAYLAVDYTLADGTSGTVYPVSQLPDVTEDLTCFVNLEALYLEDSYSTLNLSGLDKLHTLYADKDIDDIARTITPSQITSLGIYNARFDLSGLSAFSNVESLYLDGSSLLNDINEMANLPKLKNLTIVDGDYIDDLSVLYNLTQLESLSIESKSLRDVTFLTKFDNLTELTITGSKVLDFNPLAACTGLKKLYLLENYETTDYEFIKGMTQLTELGLITSFNFDDSDMPDFSALSNVTKLHVGNFESFGNLRTMTNLEELIIDDGGYGDFGSDNALLSLPKLRSLTLINSSVSPEMLRQVSEVEGLEYLDLNWSYLWGSINPILSMPNLKELNLRNASFMMDADSLSPNENLRILNLNSAKISEYSSDQWADHENLSAEEIQKALANFHGMEALMLEELKLNSVEFAKEMEHLKLLNIKNNYVVSLSPLENLQNLQAIVCETNPISDTAGLDDILVK